MYQTLQQQEFKMPSINNRTNIDRTVEIFDSFYNIQYVADANKYDVVYSYFYEINGSKSISANFTAALFRIAQQTGIDVLTLLSELQGLPNTLELNKTIAYYLNLMKSKTSLYGVSRIPTPNQSVARNVVV